MATSTSTQDTWVVVRLRGQFFGIEACYVREMTTTRQRRIYALPCGGAGVVGVLKLRDRVFPIVDLRVLLSMPSMSSETAELVGLLDERERDHVNWLNELEACVAEKRAFGLATNPHLCKFGKWYDALMSDAAAFRRLSNNDGTLERILRGVLQQFDSPHQRIHGIAVSVTQALSEQRGEDAREIIERTRTTDLAAMRQLFAEARSTVRELRQPLVGVLEIQGRQIGVLVDAIDGVREIPEEQIDRSRTTRSLSNLVAGFATRPDEPSGKMTTLLKTETLLEDFSATTRASAELQAEGPR